MSCVSFCCVLAAVNSRLGRNFFHWPCTTSPHTSPLLCPHGWVVCYDVLVCTQNMPTILVHCEGIKIEAWLETEEELRSNVWWEFLLRVAVNSRTVDCEVELASPVHWQENTRLAPHVQWHCNRQCVMPSYYDVHVRMYVHIPHFLYILHTVYIPASYYGVHACTHTKPCVLYMLPTNLYPYLCMYRSRVYWRTVPRLRSGLRTRPSDGGGSIRGTGMVQTRKRRRKVAVMIVGSRRQWRRRHLRRTRRMILSLLFTPTILVGDRTCLKWVRGS